MAVSSTSLTGYKTRIVKVDRELKQLLDNPSVDSTKLIGLQRNLDAIADEYSARDVGKLYYKTYEIQAYICLLRGEFSKATNFINEAVKLRERSYFEASSLISEIQNRKRVMRETVAQAVRQQAKKQLITGLAWFGLGMVITLISYSIADNNAQQQAIANDQSQYSFTYLSMTGAILVGGFETLRGIVSYANAPRRTNDIIDKLGADA